MPEQMVSTFLGQKPNYNEKLLSVIDRLKALKQRVAQHFEKDPPAAPTKFTPLQINTLRSATRGSILLPITPTNSESIKKLMGLQQTLASAVSMKN